MVERERLAGGILAIIGGVFGMDKGLINLTGGGDIDASFPAIAIAGLIALIGGVLLCFDKRYGSLIALIGGVFVLIPTIINVVIEEPMVFTYFLADAVLVIVGAIIGFKKS